MSSATVRNDAGQVSGGPSGDRDQSWARILSDIGPRDFSTIDSLRTEA
ncbi:hypothetical protein [Brevundimonas sp. UBA7664]|nr:hypothetical protein [Brevundimonas sp. UBA7664]